MGEQIKKENVYGENRAVKQEGSDAEDAKSLREQKEQAKKKPSPDAAERNPSHESDPTEGEA